MWLICLWLQENLLLKLCCNWVFLAAQRTLHWTLRAVVIYFIRFSHEFSWTRTQNREQRIDHFRIWFDFWTGNVLLFVVSCRRRLLRSYCTLLPLVPPRGSRNRHIHTRTAWMHQKYAENDSQFTKTINRIQITLLRTKPKISVRLNSQIAHNTTHDSILN